MISNSKNLMILSSIEECRKAITFLIEAGDLEVTDVVLRSDSCSNTELQHNGQQVLKGHRIVRLDDNTLICRICHKRFHTQNQELTELERVVFEALNPERPFLQPFAQ